MARSTPAPSAADRLGEFLAEDVGRGDITSSLLRDDATITASIVSKERGPAIVAGATHAKSIFGLRGCRARILKRDGTPISAGDATIRVTGRAYDILACERTALNLLSRMSGIATETACMASRLPKGVQIYATRKTAPGLRRFDKEAVEIGGGKRHRMGLCDAVMIKDNHIAAAASTEGITRQEAIASLVKRALQQHYHHQQQHKRRQGGARPDIEVEVESIGDAVLAAQSGATVIMLDNFGPGRIRAAVRRLGEAGLRDRVRIEASGGITGRNIVSYAASGADMISAGFITNSARGIDFSMEV